MSILEVQSFVVSESPLFKLHTSSDSHICASCYLNWCFKFICVQYDLFLSQVKVPVWIDDKEVAEYVGVGARFGKSLESSEKRASKTKVALADPPDCCSTPRNKVSLILPNCLLYLHQCQTSYWIF